MYERGKEQSVCLTQITVMVVRLVEVEQHLVMVSHEYREGSRWRTAEILS